MPDRTSESETTFRREVGCRVRVSRMSNGLRPIELAEAAGLPIAAVRRIEDGAVAVDAWQLSLIADALGVTLGGLAGRRDGW